MRKLTKDINKLTEKDIYSILLYAIYKFTEDPEYSSTAELIYTLGKDSLLSLCSTFGGCTIKVPTILQLKIFTTALLVYQLTTQEGKSFSEAYTESGLDDLYQRDVAKVYNTVKEIIQNYEE